MVGKVNKIFDDLFLRYPCLSCEREKIKETYRVVSQCYEQGGKLLLAGNGGSASDCEHIAGELMKSFCRKRRLKDDFLNKLILADSERGQLLAQKLEAPLTAIPLVAHEAMTTAFANDSDSVCIFAQQLLGFGKKGDVFFAISTSGNSENVLYACVVAKALDMKIVALTGKDGGKLAKIADVSINVPETETYKIQELHLPVYHTLCLMIESDFFTD